jgi:hypothetical protein
MDEPNYFGELLGALNTRELIQVRWRFEQRHKHRMAEIITDEIEDREALGHPDYPENVNLP